MTAQVHLDLPPTWRQVVLAPDGARAAQRALVDAWCDEHPVPAPAAARDAAVTQLVRESRYATRVGLAFAAVLLLQLDDSHLEVGERGVHLLSGSLGLGFRGLPGVRDPLLAAQGTLESLRTEPSQGYATRRLGLVGLGRDAQRPAVLVREQRFDPTTATPLSVTQVLWLVPGSEQLASATVATPNRDLAAEFTELCLGVATHLRVSA